MEITLLHHLLVILSQSLGSQKELHSPRHPERSRRIPKNSTYLNISDLSASGSLFPAQADPTERHGPKEQPTDSIAFADTHNFLLPFSAQNRMSSPKTS
jgi:hypothetical protein